MQKKFIILIVLFAFFYGCTKKIRDNDSESTRSKSTTVNQFAVIKTLLDGNYISNISYAEIRKNGNFGLGTFNKLHGEMVALNGKFYQATVDGKVTIVADSLFAPFAVVHNFVADKKINIEKEIGSFDELKSFLDPYVINRKDIYAFKIHAKFDSLKVRSVPQQEEPFPTLADVVKNQTIFELKNIEGTLVGYWFPDYLKDVNASGFHMHFISDDKKHAGHLLKCSFKSAEAEQDELTKLNLIIPQNSAYQNN